MSEEESKGNAEAKTRNEEDGDDGEDSINMRKLAISADIASLLEDLEKQVCSKPN